jgi:hypothetical protein
MIKGIRKKVVFAISMLVSGAFGFMFTGTKGVTTQDVDSLLEKPIFSIEKASADGAGGDCCCGCDAGGGDPPSTPGSAWVHIDIDEIEP